MRTPSVVSIVAILFGLGTASAQPTLAKPGQFPIASSDEAWAKLAGVRIDAVVKTSKSVGTLGALPTREVQSRKAWQNSRGVRQ